MRVKFAHIALVICLVSPLSVLADSRSDAVDRLFTSYNAANVPGASVLVMQHGEVLYAHAYGAAKLNPRQAASVETNFRIASLTKQFTALAVLQLVDRGMVGLEDPLTKFFPDFPAYGQKIKLKHLLQHTSGLLDYENLMSSQNGQISDEGVLQLLRQQSGTSFAPGSQYRYSNGAYVLLGLIIQKLDGRPFSQFVREEILAPLQMNQSLMYERDADISSRAYGHTRSGNGFAQTDQSSTSATQGDGGLYTSVADWVQWERELLQPTLLHPTIFSLLFAPGVLNNGTRTSYGMGWMLSTYRGLKQVYHTGSSIGFRTAVRRFPEKNFTVVVLVNRADAAPWNTATSVADIYLFP